MVRVCPPVSKAILLASVAFALGLGVASVPPALAAQAEPAWCRVGLETLPGNVCHIDGGSQDGRRTLVIFLHGAIAEGVTWQWGQEQALTRHARQNKFEAIFPMAPLTKGGHVWPGSPKAREAVEDDLIATWTKARRLLEARNGRPFDEVFVMGFSSGAYFVSSLALRNKLTVDGYAVFAGGTGFGTNEREGGRDKPPVFVGVCAKDKQTAAHSRAFGALLAGAAFPHRVDEEDVGHEFSDIHLAHAVAYLRSVNRRKG